MDESWPFYHAVNHGTFLSRVDVLRLALTSSRVARALNWIALWRNEDSSIRRPQLSLSGRPRQPITFAPSAVDALCDIAALDEGNAAAFRRLATCGPQGRVVIWGNAGESDNAPTDANFVAIACGYDHSVALRADGIVVTWCLNEDGQRNDAPTDANFIAVACGWHHSVGLRADGTVVTWGDSIHGQRDDAPTDANFVAVACRTFHSVGLRADGTVVKWGGTRHGQRNDAPTEVNFVAIACGRDHSVALRADGTVENGRASCKDRVKDRG